MNPAKNNTERDNMKEYKIVEADNKREAERLMNEMAADGWEVVSLSYWSRWKLCLLITFSR